MTIVPKVTGYSISQVSVLTKKYSDTSNEISMDPNPTVPLAKYNVGPTEIANEISSLDPISQADSRIAVVQDQPAQTSIDMSQFLVAFTDIGEQKTAYPAIVPISADDQYDTNGLRLANFRISTTRPGFENFFDAFNSRVQNQDFGTRFNASNLPQYVHDAIAEQGQSIVGYNNVRLLYIKDVLQRHADATINNSGEYSITFSDVVFSNRDYGDNAHSLSTKLYMTITASQGNNETLFFGQDLELPYVDVLTSYHIRSPGGAPISWWGADRWFNRQQTSSTKTKEIVYTSQISGVYDATPAELKCDFSDLSPVFDNMTTAGATSLIVSGFKVDTPLADLSQITDRVNGEYTSMTEFRNHLAAEGWRLLNADSVLSKGYSVTYSEFNQDELIITRSDPRGTNGEKITQVPIPDDTHRSEELYGLVNANYDYIAAGGELLINFAAGTYNFSAGIDLDRISLPGNGKIAFRGQSKVDTYYSYQTSNPDPEYADLDTSRPVYEYRTTPNTVFIFDGPGVNLSVGPNACPIEFQSIEFNATSTTPRAISVTNSSTLRFNLPMKVSGNISQYGMYVKDNSRVYINDVSHLPQGTLYSQNRWTNTGMRNFEFSNTSQIDTAIAIYCSDHSKIYAKCSTLGRGVQPTYTRAETQGIDYGTSSPIRFTGSNDTLSWFKNLIIDQHSSMFLYGAFAFGNSAKIYDKGALSIAELDSLAAPEADNAIRSIDIKGNSLLFNFNDFPLGQWAEYTYQTTQQAAFGQTTTRPTLRVSENSKFINTHLGADYML